MTAENLLAVEKATADAHERFVCELGLRFSNELEKRYPFGECDWAIKISIPLSNVGPGIATDVTAQPAVWPSAYSY
jgi:hypothetical protein